MLTAIVLGATGLVGSQLLQQLLHDDRFLKVVVVGRRHLSIQHPKLEELIVNFDKPEDWQHLIVGDVLFSAFGTTIGKAGSKEAQYKVDYTYQYRVAEAAAKNNVPVYVLVSAAGAKPDSFFFYNRMKGELERDVLKLPFKSIQILQPGILTGDRKENRTGEKIGIAIANVLHHIPGLGRYKPVKDTEIASAMINASFVPEGINRYALDEVFGLAEKKP